MTNTDRNIDMHHIAELGRAFEQIRAAAHVDHERWKTAQTEYLAGKVDGLDYAALIVGRLLDQLAGPQHNDGSGGVNE